MVCGLAKSGAAALGLLAAHGARVDGTDSRPEAEIKTKAEIAPDFAGRLLLGADPTGFVHEYDLIVISPGISARAGFVRRALAFGIPVWGEVELAYALCPCPIVAITGTNGKTTVTSLVGEIMKKSNPKTVVGGNIGVPLTRLVGHLDGESLLVAEISSFQLETARGFRPRVSAVLNVTEDHLDRHGDMAAYIAEKEKIFANQRQNDIAVLNYDNPITKKMRPRCRVVFFSQREELPQGVWLRGGDIIANGRRVAGIPGAKMPAENALAAAALCLSAGASAADVESGLAGFKGIEHRLEHVAKVGGTDYYNDSKATNVDSTIKALQSFGHPVALIAGGYDKGADFAPLVGLFGKKVSRLFLLGQTAEKIAAECARQGFSGFEICASLEDAVAAAAGRTVLFSPACASFGMFRDFEERGRRFKELVLAMAV